MPLVTLFTREPALRAAIVRAGGSDVEVAGSPCWDGLLRLVRERPATGCVVDLDAFSGGVHPEHALGALRRDFPHVGLTIVAHGVDDPLRLFRLGRAAIPDVLLLRADAVEKDFPRKLSKALRNGTSARVVRAISPHVPRGMLEVVRRALDEIHVGWPSDDFAESVGLSRPVLSEHLKEWGLPSVGKLLTWSKMLHAAHWLAEPGRSGESVSRQLEYANGSTFRRALRTYLDGLTPTGLIEEGGLDYALPRFLDYCGFSDLETGGTTVSVA